MAIVENEEVALRVARQLLLGSGFASFEFSSAYRLKFCKARVAISGNTQLPVEVCIDLEGKWWFGADDQWRNLVDSLSPIGGVEPEESVQAFMLAKLRWSSGSVIESLDIQGTSLILEFTNRTVLTVLGAVDEAASWRIFSVPINGEPTGWSVTSSGGSLYVSVPDESESTYLG
jgi:hypothetical protein